ncbi:MAG: porin, partial [Rhabdaerophilum sp.]
MKLVKSLLLGSAAGLVAVAGASAADLGVKKPTAVEYVKTCPTYGAGFFVVPGTTSCLKLIGRVRLDYIFDNPRTNVQNSNRFRARGYVGFDHRTATEYGLLRTYVRAFFQRENAVDSTTLEYAFIQFGGLTAGRVTPIFEHGWNQFYMFSGQGGIGYHSDISYTNSIGYTQSFGGGFSATIAIDDSRERRLGIAGGTVTGAR